MQENLSKVNKILSAVSSAEALDLNIEAMFNQMEKEPDAIQLDSLKVIAIWLLNQ